MKSNLTLLAAVTVLASQSALAANISVTDAWARATMPGQKVSAAYLQIQSDADARLVSASSPAVPRVEVHEMKMDGDVMRMREVKGYDVPAKGAFELKPGGAHLMFMDLKRPLKEGEKVPVKLKFAKAGEVSAEFEVGGMGSTAPPMQHKH